MEHGNEMLYILRFAHELFFGETEEEIPHSLPKIEDFVEEIVPRFPDHQFKEHFRMNPSTFEHFLTLLHEVVPHAVRVGKPAILLEKQVLMCIWYIANIESFRSVAQRFGVSKSTAWEVVLRVGNWILELNRRYRVISWPSGPRANDVRNAFEEINGFPGVLGCIDGSHVEILKPKENPASYYNRNKFHSVVLQAICDHKKLFTDVFVGMPGSCHDSRVFDMSDISTRIINNEVEFPNNSFIIGDLAYTLNTYLIVGFKDFGNLSNRQKMFNKKLSQLRVHIEQAFALLKGRFRRLKKMDTLRLDIISVIVVAACILHNICILQGEGAEDILNLEQELLEERRLLHDEEENNRNLNRDLNNRREAMLKRNNIMNNLRF